MTIPLTRMMLVTAVCAAIYGTGGAAIGAEPTTRKVELKDAQGQVVGTATLSDAAGGVQIQLAVTHLPAGEHAFHIHQFARCEPPGFTTAGPHFNPENKKHGLDNPDGPHAGDMNNFTVAADGTASVTLTDPRVSFGTGGNSLFTDGGTALVVHAKADDMKTDPSGNAGDRIACGSILR